MKQVWVFIVASLLISCGAAVTLGPGVRFESPLNNVTYSINSTLTVQNYVNFTEGILDLGTKTIDAGGPYSKVLNINPPFNSITRSFIAVNYTRRIGTPPPNYTVSYGGLQAGRPYYLKYFCGSSATTIDEGVSGTTYKFNVSMQCLGNIDPKYVLSIIGDTCITDKYGSDRFYNITFFHDEEQDRWFNFTEHTPAYLDIICPTNGSDRITLNDSIHTLSYYTYEQPIFELKADDGAQIRRRTMTEDNVSVEFYMLDGVSQLMTFTLVDYTPIFGDSTFYIFHTLNYSLKEVFSSRWDIQREVKVSLRNNTPYSLKVVASDGSVRDFGFLTFQPGETSKSVEITGVNMGEHINHYEGGVSLSFTQNYGNKLLSLSYDKDEGDFDSVNYTVFDMDSEPYIQIYSTKAEDTISGTMSYTVPDTDINNSFYLQVEAVSDGKKIVEGTAIFLLNQSAKIIDLDLPATLMGAASSRIYEVVSILVMIVVAFGFGVVDAGIGAVVVGGFGMLFTYIGWLTMVPWWLWSVLMMLAVALKMGGMREVNK